jgi:hypothetical protein
MFTVIVADCSKGLLLLYLYMYSRLAAMTVQTKHLQVQVHTMIRKRIS